MVSIVDVREYRDFVGAVDRARAAVLGHAVSGCGSIGATDA